MKRFFTGEERTQITLLLGCPYDDFAADNPVRLVEAFVDELDLTALGFAGAVPSSRRLSARASATSG